MSFEQADYQRAAKALDVPVAHIKAIAAVESAGETFWVLDQRLVVPVRFEAHWFGKLTGYKFNTSHPTLSCVDWNPALAAKTRAGAWEQVNAARALNRDAANQSASWGAFQIMGFHWQALRYNSSEAFVDSMSANGDDGQMDAFAKFIDADDVLQRALRDGDWQTVETRYNGGGYGGAYAAKLEAAVRTFGGTGAPRPMRYGDRGSDVAALQTALGAPADGDFGPATEARVTIFQHKNGLKPDGIAGALTLKALGL